MNLKRHQQEPRRRSRRQQLRKHSFGTKRLAVFVVNATRVPSGAAACPRSTLSKAFCSCESSPASKNQGSWWSRAAAIKRPVELPWLTLRGLPRRFLRARVRQTTTTTDEPRVVWWVFSDNLTQGRTAPRTLEDAARAALANLCDHECQNPSRRRSKTLHQSGHGDQLRVRSQPSRSFVGTILS